MVYCSYQGRLRLCAEPGAVYSLDYALFFFLKAGELQFESTGHSDLLPHVPLLYAASCTAELSSTCSI